VRLLDFLKTAKSAVVIQRVEAVVRRTYLGLPIQRICVDDTVLGRDCEGAHHGQRRPGEANPPADSDLSVSFLQ
jgi:hypothetical protein